jgi:hypothetical protein
VQFVNINHPYNQMSYFRVLSKMVMGIKLKMTDSVIINIFDNNITQIFDEEPNKTLVPK